MTRTLPLDDVTWPDHRVLVRQTWADGNSNPVTSGDGWTPLPMAKPPQRGQVGGNGCRVLEYERVALPQVGTARFACRFGLIDENIVVPPDVAGWEVRIQVRAVKTDGTFGAFRTVFWGQCLMQEDQGQPGSYVPAGDRVYHCVDGLYRTSRWRLDRSGYAARKRDGSFFQGNGPTHGNPGYNYQRDKESRLEGNRWSSQWTTEGGLTVDYHTWPGQGLGADGSSGNYWTDMQALTHALESTRPSGEPRIQLQGIVDPFQTTSVWPVHEGDSAFDLASRICRRERGRGLVFIDWNDDSGNPNGPLTCRLTACNQNIFDIDWKNPVDGSAQNIAGSTNVTGSGFGAVDLIGDHRVVANAFKLGDTDQYRVDALESLGEPIEVVVTLSFQDGLTGTKPNQDAVSLERGWLDSEQTAFRAITDRAQRVEERWRPVYQYWRLPMTWDGTCGDGENGGGKNGVSLCRADYRCDDFGVIVSPSFPGSYGDGVKVDEAYFTQLTNPLLVEILHQLPMYEQFDYTSAPPVQRGGNAPSDSPNRRNSFAYFRQKQDLYLFAHEYADNNGMALAKDVYQNVISLYDVNNHANGSRSISDTTFSSASAKVDYQNLGFTVGIRLPHRVRLYSGALPTDPLCKRRVAINYSNIHLWLAHPGAIWDLDATTGSRFSGHTAKRRACGGTLSMPGILRDDRAKLAQLHAMAWSWYGNDRRSAQWAIRDCGFLGSYQAYPGSAVPSGSASLQTYFYPSLGQVVTTIAANGDTTTVNTPVTRIHYDNTIGVTRWECDWCGLDVE